MRARNIKPSFFKSEGLADCSHAARLLFIGLWCMADREGRLEDRPARIKAELFPYDNANIEKLINEIASKKDCDGTPSFIVRYGHPKRYIQILHFLSHQHPHSKEQESEIPAYNGEDTQCLVQTPGKHRTSTVLAGLNPESLLLNPDTLNPDTPQSGQARYDYFSDFWKDYPKKVARADAERSFSKLKMNDDLMEQVMTGLFRDIDSTWKGKEIQYIPNPTTWLNQRRWLDGK